MERRVLPASQQATKPVAQKAMGPCELTGVTRVLVRFTVKNEEHVPLGLPTAKGLSEMATDAKRASIAKALGWGVTKVEGRTHTGEQVVDNLSMVSLGTLSGCLRGLGYHFSFPHYFVKDGNYGRRFVVVFPYVFGGEECLDVHDEVIDLLASTWQFCHVFRNHDGSVGIELIGLMADARPKHRLELQGSTIVVVPA